MGLTKEADVIAHYWKQVDDGEASPLLEVDIKRTEIFDNESVPCATFLGRLESIFIECDLRGCDFTQANIDGSTFIRCQLTGASFPLRAIYSSIDCVENDLFQAISKENLHARNL